MTETEIAVRDERQAAQNKMLTALIDAAAVANPSLKQRVTVAAVWQYLRLPDTSFGWVPRVNHGDPVPPLPVECKALCVITTLALGLTPGLGNVLWLGNKCFIDVYGKRTLAQREIELRGRKIRPLTADERTMFGLRDGDMALCLEQEFARKSDPERASTGIGYGIIDSNEFSSGKKPGLQTRKDAAMSLITRAERDFYNRYIAIDGISDMPEDPRAYADQLEPAQIGPSAEATTIAAELAQPGAPALRTAPERAVDAASAVALRKDAAFRLGNLQSRVTDCGGSASEVAGVQMTMAWIDEASADELNDVGDVLEAWLAEHEAPPPETPAPPKAKRGRPPKAAQPAAAPVVTQTSAALPPEPVAHAGEYHRTGLTEEEIAAGCVEPDLDDEGETFPPKEPDRTAERQAGEATTLAKAKARAKAAVDRVHDAGGAAMKVLGFNPFNRIEQASGTAGAAELETMADLLDKWAPDKPSVAEKAVAAKTTAPPMDAPPPDDRDAPGRGPAQRHAAAPPAQPQARPPLAAAPPAAPIADPRQGAARVPALDMLDRIFATNASAPPAERVPEPTLARLRDLKARKLNADDHLRLPKFFRESKAGNHRGLDEMLKDRPMVK